ncbi:26S proteasome non-ATPase regulatory subunit 2 [Ditylenchus destructor]|uniref:26S proteasome non-ATPase regulatory subunit 2 n=1 Tax=Ditylenchus destructor TaxID=166010 RepID=A0AAD4NG16_9BILA|nr:26S proteasome non-ATPase regulatory subunit 2 [Ditylenchus destructor]
MAVQKTLQKKDEKVEKETEMTEEDKKLQEDLNLLVQRLTEPDVSLYGPSLETMRSLIRASTTSMTSVPKPLKFMRPHYAKMKEIYEAMPESDTKRLSADVISALAMCADEEGDCINYRLKGKHEPIGDWGHDHLCMEMADEWSRGSEDDPRRADLLQLVREIITHNIKHNAEVEVCDLLNEIGQLPLLLDYADQLDYARVCLYLLSCAPLMAETDSHALILCAKDLYLKSGKPIEALRCAIILNDVDMIRSIYDDCKDVLNQKQMAILLGRHQIFLELDNEHCADLNSNVHLHRHFQSLARELDIMEPKKPEDIYKAHLEQSRPFANTISDSARVNLAASFVNGFVNCGFGADKLLADTDGANKWFSKNREWASLSAAASQGLIHRWDIDRGLTQCDRFLYSDDDYIRAGTLLAIGITSCGIQDPVDPACAILMDHIQSDRIPMRIGSILGLGLAYANSKRETVVKEEEGGVVYELKKLFSDTKPSATPEVKGLAGLALGFILVGTADHEAAGDMLTYLHDESVDITEPNNRFVALGIALIFLGTQERCEVMVESVRALPEPFGSMIATLVEVSAYAGTGNVLKIQSLLHICSEHYETASKDDKKKGDTKGNPAAKTEGDKSADSKETKIDYSAKQAVAVLGIGLIAMGEEVGSAMCLRTFGHLMRYGETVIRRAVPLALALVSPSNPQLNILEILSKYSHDSDADTARNAIFALGIVGAGTNNARLVTMLRQLASYHAKDQVTMMLVRIAQGLTHMGKGTMTLNPFHSDRQLMCPAAVAALFSTCFAFLDAEHSVLSNKQHYLLYNLVVAIQPRLLITLIEEENNPDQLKPINVSVRVGQAVDTVAQAGKPKTITGFQTHSTPVLLAYGERAELATDEYISLTPHIEGLVILKKNPDSEVTKSSAVKK